MTMTSSRTGDVGELLRDWRRRRRLTQMDLALEAGVSTRHLSFVETGRSSASRDMLHRLAEHLSMPLRVRNALLNAAGLAPEYRERSLDTAELDAPRRAIDLVLKGHEPFPALAIDRHWILLSANRAIAPLLADVDPALLEQPVNVLRLSLHPHGLAPRIENLGEWRGHLLARLRKQIAETQDPALSDLLDELSAYPFRTTTAQRHDPAGIAIPLRLHVPGVDRPLSLISTTTVFGTPLDITLEEIALECFYPADDPTRDALARLWQAALAQGDQT